MVGLSEMAEPSGWSRPDPWAELFQRAAPSPEPARFPRAERM